MEGYIWWAVIGIALIIAELATATFYLLVIGIAALAASAMAYLNYSFWIQALVAVAAATIGVVLATRFRASRVAASPGLDVGQSVVFDSWVSEKDRLARVRYRNSLWDARVPDAQAVETGEVFYIQRADGNMLHISKVRPA
jgi:membrane protein implicated in regulation of membrane protease activity